MKKNLIRIGLGITALLAAAFIGAYIWIDVAVKENISTAQENYPGIAEDALIAFLLDSDNSYNDRTHLAIWTLGQIKSEKALPILNELYNDDPKGETCYGKHDLMLCQRELYNALKACNSDWLPLHSRLNK